MATRNALRRSLLYSKEPSSPRILLPYRVRASSITNPPRNPVPGSSQRFIDKSRTLSADCVAYDLEDSVTPHKKAEARSLVRRAIDQPAPTGIRERAVRINSVDSGLALADLTEVVSLLTPSTLDCSALLDRTIHRITRQLTNKPTAPIPQSKHDSDPQSKHPIRPHLCD